MDTTNKADTETKGPAGPSQDKELVALVLRDPERTESLRKLIRSHGGRAISLPAFHFQTIYDCPAALALLRNPKAFDWAFFVSPQGAASLTNVSRRAGLRLPVNLACAAPGQASRQTLIRAGFQNIVSHPGVGDVKSMIKDNLLGSLRGKKVALVQRVDAASRALLALRQAGSLPTPIECYRMIRNERNFWPSLDQQLRSDINAIMAFDAASLDVLLQSSASDTQFFKNLPLGVIHKAIASKAEDMGFKNIITTGDSKVMILELKKMVDKQHGSGFSSNNTKTET